MPCSRARDRKLRGGDLLRERPLRHRLLPRPRAVDNGETRDRLRRHLELRRLPGRRLHRHRPRNLGEPGLFCAGGHCGTDSLPRRRGRRRRDRASTRGGTSRCRRLLGQRLHRRRRGQLRRGSLLRERHLPGTNSCHDGAEDNGESAIDCGGTSSCGGCSGNACAGTGQRQLRRWASTARACRTARGPDLIATTARRTTASPASTGRRHLELAAAARATRAPSTGKGTGASSANYCASGTCGKQLLPLTARSDNGETERRPPATVDVRRLLRRRLHRAPARATARPGSTARTAPAGTKLPPRRRAGQRRDRDRLRHRRRAAPAPAAPAPAPARAPVWLRPLLRERDLRHQLLPRRRAGQRRERRRAAAAPRAAASARAALAPAPARATACRGSTARTELAAPTPATTARRTRRRDRRRLRQPRRAAPARAAPAIGTGQGTCVAGLYCANGTCGTNSCHDGAQDNGESGVDCGTATCGNCSGAASHRHRPGQLRGGALLRGDVRHQLHSCHDGAQDNGESAVDCGGTSSLWRLPGRGLHRNRAGHLLHHRLPDALLLERRLQHQDSCHDGVKDGASETLRSIAAARAASAGSA